jgi:hypothetical protein
MKRLSQTDLDGIGSRLLELEAEKDRLNSQLKDQIEEFGSTPPRAEKSKRLQGSLFQFTLSTSTSTEVRDAEVERIRDACPAGIFSQLFIAVTKYKLAKGATMLLAGTLPEDAPRDLRRMFSRAVSVTEGSPRLRIERLNEAVPA